MDEKEIPGKQTVLVVIGLMLIPSVFTILLYNLLEGQDRLASQMFRLSLSSFLCWSMYCRKPWARGIVIILMGLSVLLEFMRISQGGLNSILCIFLVLHSMLLLLLLFGPGVKQYFSYDDYCKPKKVMVEDDF